MNVSEENCSICAEVPARHRNGHWEMLIDKIFIYRIDLKPKPICDACLKAH
jgi:hypothetical protein